MSFEYILVARLCSPGLLSRKLLMKLPLLLPESRSRNSPRLKINVAWCKCHLNLDWTEFVSIVWSTYNNTKTDKVPPGVWRGPCCQKPHCLCPDEAPGCFDPLPPDSGIVASPDSGFLKLTAHTVGLTVAAALPDFLNTFPHWLHLVALLNNLPTTISHLVAFPKQENSVAELATASFCGQYHLGYNLDVFYFEDWKSALK